MNNREFADSMVVLISDQTACSRLSKVNLIVMHGVLLAIAGWLEAEIHRRE